MDLRKCNNIVLASGSPRRRELLDQVGVKFTVQVSGVEEVVTSTEPDKVVKELSSQKAHDVFAKNKGDVVVIGADTVVAHNGHILGKPTDQCNAFNMIKELANTSHSVYTGVTVCVRQNGIEKAIVFSEETKVFTGPITDTEIEEYIASGEPMDKAGAYGIQGLFGQYVTSINGDYNNVVGLPVSRLMYMCKNEL